jgi:hypothetical protein
MATATLGVICLASAIEGWLFHPCNSVEKGLLFVAAVTLIKPGIITDFIGLFLFGLVILFQKLHRKKYREAPVLVINEKSSLRTEAFNPAVLQEKSSSSSEANFSHSSKTQLETWKSWGPLVAGILICFWITYAGVHFTHYWIFLGILGLLAFFLVFYYVHLLKKISMTNL